MMKNYDDEKKGFESNLKIVRTQLETIRSEKLRKQFIVDSYDHNKHFSFWVNTNVAILLLFNNHSENHIFDF